MLKTYRFQATTYDELWISESNEPGVAVISINNGDCVTFKRETMEEIGDLLRITGYGESLRYKMTDEEKERHEKALGNLRTKTKEESE